MLHIFMIQCCLSLRALSYYSFPVEISQISRIERGVINTSIGNINAIAKILKIDPKDLFDF